MKKNIITTTIIILLTGLISFLLYYHKNYKEKTFIAVNSYIKKVYKLERGFIENIPIYSDFASPIKEKKLRKFLLMDHIKAAKKYGISPVRNNNETVKYEKQGKLIKLKKDKNNLYYFYNVKKNHRYLTKTTAKGLDMLTKRYQENLNKKTKLPAVKLAISSALRPVNYQNSLRTRNMNASYISTHSYGTSFDIFYDDYFVKLPGATNSKSLSEKIKNRLSIKFGYLLGDSLRRQLRSVLMETLLQLQEEGKIYAILEKRQRCYHITILK